jgi:hypothetical protein
MLYGLSMLLMSVSFKLGPIGLGRQQITCVNESHFLITTPRVHMTFLLGTVRSYKIVYANSLSFFACIC